MTTSHTYTRATLNALESNGFGLIKHGDLFAHTLGRGGEQGLLF